MRVAVDLARTPTLAAHVSEQARARVAHLDWQQMAMQVESLMLQAMDPSSSADAVPRPDMAHGPAPLSCNGDDAHRNKWRRHAPRKHGIANEKNSPDVTALTSEVCMLTIFHKSGELLNE